MTQSHIVPVHYPHIEHRKATFSPDGTILEQDARVYSSPEAVQQFFCAELEREKLKYEYSLQNALQSYQHQQVMYGMQLQGFLAAVEVEMQRMDNERQRLQLENQNFQLYAEKQIAILTAQIENTIDKSKQLAIEDSSQYMVGKDFAEDAQYEVISPIGTEAKSPFDKSAKSTTHIQGGSMSDEKTDDQTEESGITSASSEEYLQKLITDKDYVMANKEYFGLIFDYKTNRMNNVPLNFYLEFDKFRDNTMVMNWWPDNGKNTIDKPPETIPKTPNGWEPVDYVHGFTIPCETYAMTGTDENDVDEWQFRNVKSQRLTIFKHFIPSSLKMYAGESTDIYWEAWDILFNTEWKEIVGKVAGGIVKGQVGIIRTLRNEANGFSTSYLTMYMRNNSLSQYFDSEYIRKYREKERLRREDGAKNIDMRINVEIQYPLKWADYPSVTYPDGTIVMDKTDPTFTVKGAMERITQLIAELETPEDEFENPTVKHLQKLYLDFQNYLCFGHFVSALLYAHTINKNREFVIIEQISASNDSTMKLINEESKTEIRREWNIFCNEFAYCDTNCQSEKFMCKYHSQTDSFVITRMFRTHPIIGRAKAIVSREIEEEKRRNGS